MCKFFGGVIFILKLLITQFVGKVEFRNKDEYLSVTIVPVISLFIVLVLDCFKQMEVVKAEAEVEDSMLEVTKELFKTILYAITDMETFQPKPKKITVVSRIYRLLGVKSTTPNELFSRKVR